ncbi:MAG: MBL fold metallo-hydrolase [Myxococcota bacterium]
MKRILLLALALVLAAVFGMFWWLGPIRAPALPESLSSHRFVHPVAAGDVISYIIAPPEGTVVLVNTGDDPEAAAIRSELERLGRSANDVGAILLTHGSYDHWAGVKRFPRAVVYASAEDLELIDHARRIRSTLPRIRMRLKGRPEKPKTMRSVLSSERLVFGRTVIECVALPGVTKGSTAYRFDDVVFVGDTLWGNGRGFAPPAASWLERPEVVRKVLPRLERYPSIWIATSRHGLVARDTALPPASSIEVDHH